jgi:hypothetical protein
MANDRLLHFMARLLYVEKHGEFAVTSQFVIDVRPLFIRNSRVSAEPAPRLLPQCTANVRFGS